MSTNRRRKVLGAAVTAAAALTVTAAFSAPAFAADAHAQTAEPTVSASSESHSSATIHFNGRAFELHVAPQFQQDFTPDNPKLSGGATLVDGGFRLGGGSGTFDFTSGSITENLKGTLTYTESDGPHPFTINVKHFKFEVRDFETAELAGDVRITGLATQTISERGLDLLDLKLTQGKFSFDGNFLEANDVPGLLSDQAAQIAGGIVPPGSFIADTNFSIPIP